MFDLFSWSHILILLAVALVVVGPKDLPKLMHMAGKWVGKARGLANEFKKSFDDMARQSELDELRKEIESLRTNETVDSIHADLNRPLESNAAPAAAAPGTGAPVAAAPVTAVSGPDSGPEPRAGEFKITDTSPTVAASEPVGQ